MLYGDCSHQGQKTIVPGVSLSVCLFQVQIMSGCAIKEQLFDMSAVEYLVIFFYLFCICDLEVQGMHVCTENYSTII